MADAARQASQRSLNSTPPTATVPAASGHRGQHRQRRRTRMDAGPGRPSSRARRASFPSAHVSLRIRPSGSSRRCAIRHVHILAHPRGRMSVRAPASWPTGTSRVRRGGRAGVAVEIDGDPAAQYLDYESAARALAAGCLFAADSDAHTTPSSAMPKPPSHMDDLLPYPPIASSTAGPPNGCRLAGGPPLAHLNCRGRNQLCR